MNRLSVYINGLELVIDDDKTGLEIPIAKFNSEAACVLFMRFIEENQNNILISETKHEEPD